MSQATIITIGTELMEGRVWDSNTGWIARRLEAAGLRVRLAMTVPDDAGEIGAAMRQSLNLNPALVVVAGGLGPTVDDITASSLAVAVGRKLVADRRAAAMVAAALGTEPDSLGERQLKQAAIPEGAVPVDPAGTAPGFLLKSAGAVVAAFPGVPWELREMWPRAASAEPLASLLAAASGRLLRSLFLYGVGEPEVSAAVEDLAPPSPAGPGLSISICSRRREVMVDVSFEAATEDAAESFLASLRRRLEPHVFSEGEAIEAVIGGRLAQLGQTLATGESCTGGLLGAAITSVDGSSRYFRGGVIAYHNQAKERLLGVDARTLESHGAVSEPVARQMALGARAALGADYGIGVTGIAGPGGGTPQKPVGLVFICVSSGEVEIARRFDFPGGRDEVRRAAVTASLHMLDEVLNGGRQ